METTGLKFTVKGQIKKPGTYELSNGENLLSLIFSHAGGMASSRFLLKGVLVGGPFGYFAKPEELQQPLRESAEVMVFDEGSCIVNVVRLLLLYNQWQLKRKEQNGCPACTAGVERAVAILARLSSARGSSDDVEQLKDIAAHAHPGCPSDCGALRPLASALQLWGEDFCAHGQGHCPASICDELMLSPCSNACPANVDLPGTLALMQMGKVSEAFALGRHDNPFFLTCGFVCEDPPCQKNCKRINFDEAIYSQGLHRYAGERAAKLAGSLEKAVLNPAIRPGAPTGKKVAIAGGGPAGLSAAYILARLGHSVTVYEQHDLPGGMAAYGIPAYRLPRHILAAEIEAVKALGVEIKTGCTLGRDMDLNALRRDYDAVLLALGAGKSRKLPIPGQELSGVRGALGFLFEAAQGTPTNPGSRVLVAGGGNVAIDAARTALRLGAEHVDMMCVEDQLEMPASENEIKAAEEEGVGIKTLSVPVEFTRKEQKVSVRYAKVQPGPYNLKGVRWPPVPLMETVAEELYDTVVIAIGQTPDLDCLEGALSFKGNWIAHGENMETEIEGVFAAGDCGDPLNSVVKAVGSGKRAAYSIDNYLTGREHRLEAPFRRQIGCYVGTYNCMEAQRAGMPVQEAAIRIRNFDPVELGLSDNQAAGEILRCICAAKGEGV